MKSGAMVRDARRRHGISQASLARRAGTSQARISRIERDLEAVTLERLRTLLVMCGERLVVTGEPFEIPAEHRAAAARMTPADRLAEAASWNRLATTVEIAGEEARRG